MRRLADADSLPEMIARAQQARPALDLRVCNALDLPFTVEFDVVFSNAVFHWNADHDRLPAGVHQALHPGDLLVCEFGTGGSIAVIERAFAACLAAHGLAPRPTTARDRPAPFEGCEEEPACQARQCFADCLDAMDPAPRKDGPRGRADACSPRLRDGRQWTIDYRWLRVVAARRMVTSR